MTNKQKCPFELPITIDDNGFELLLSDAGVYLDFAEFTIPDRAAAGWLKAAIEE